MISELNKHKVIFSAAIAFLLILYGTNSVAQQKSLIFPVPSEIKPGEGSFILDSNVFVALSGTKNSANEFLSGLFLNELADKYRHSLSKRKQTIIKAGNKFILIGTLNDPLVKAYCTQKKLVDRIKQQGKEGYFLSVSDKIVLVAANDNEGALWGLSSLRQLVQKQKGVISLPQLTVWDAPLYLFRGIKLYLPGKENIQFFKRFIRDFAVLYKYNTIILELNANMRLDKHPELNIGAIEFAKHLKYSRLDRPPGIHQEYQNSSHQDNADGQILEKEEVADLIAYMRRFGIEVIPELPSLTHSYYLLAGHGELAENPFQPYPDTYCPLKPGSYHLYFDVLDEYIDVVHPKTMHVGHDEWRMEKDICQLCRGKDYGELFLDDLKKIHDHLAAKGIKTAIWGDHLLESVTQKDHQLWKSSSGYTYKIPGALRPEQVRRLPKDIIVFNWFWNDPNNDKQVADFGFKQVIGNMRADINDWGERKKAKGLLGGAPSSWAGTTELNFGKDQLFDFIGCANLLWSTEYLNIDTLALVIEQQVPSVYKNLKGTTLPSDDAVAITPLDISSAFTASFVDSMATAGHKGILTGSIQAENKSFNLAKRNGNDIVFVGNYSASSSPAILIGKDVSSLVFLHACKSEALNNKAYGAIYNFDDTAEPLGYYEVQYDDGITINIPLRYGINILDWRWKQRVFSREKEKAKYSQSKYAYQAAAVECAVNVSAPATFFAFEWENPRYGKKIKEIRLKGVNTAKGNAIALLAVGSTETKKATAATGTEAQ